MKGKLAKYVAPQAAALSTVKNASDSLISAWKEYSIIREQETTKREAISAWRDVQLEKYKSQREVLSTYLKQTFAERRDVIQGLFDKLDEGIDSDNQELVDSSMSAIVSIVQTSPLQQAQKIIDMTDDPDVEEIEI